jgi:hypothetical protein
MGALNRALAAAVIASGMLAIVRADAAPSACPQHFAGGESPDLTNPRLSANTYGLCYTGYAGPELSRGHPRQLIPPGSRPSARHRRGDVGLCS